MDKKERFFSVETLMIVLGAVCLVLAGFIVYLQPGVPALAVVGVLLLVVCVVALLLVGRLRRGLRRLLSGRAVGDAADESGLSAMGLPAVALKNGRVVWYNPAFKALMGGEDVPLAKAGAVIPGLDEARCQAEKGQDLKLGDKRYTVFGSHVKSGEGLFLVAFVEDTGLKHDAEEYKATRPSVIYFMIDTYDEILKELRESERARIMSEIDLQLEKYVGGANGLLRRVSNSRYVAVVEERHIEKMVNGRFDILDKARKVDDEASVSLSIGVGRRGKSLHDCEQMAAKALDMALGRGGDQAAVNSPDGFEFYGGLSRSVEKRTKVKSRIIAQALKDLIGQHQRVIVMGHKNSDMDSVGAAAGILRFCKICKKDAWICVDYETSLAGSLLDMLLRAGYKDDILAPDDALELANSKTLLVVVDTHMPYLLESKDVYEACGTTVVIDHHRRMVGHIDDAVIFYHEPYASSASELVSEMLQYVGESKEDKPTPAEAEAMLAGIMLDTRTFSLHVGVRTFEASAYLRRVGAQTANVKKLFASTMDEYLYRGNLVSEAKVLKGCAVVVSDRVPPECEVVAPQAANDLLTIEGVKASFVAILQGGQVRISARSMGEVNVQLVLEKLGGGGHLTMAGAQLRDVSLAEAEKRLMEAIEKYWEENASTVPVKV